MSPARLYRAASVLLLLFGVGHQYGFRRVDPGWGVDAVLGAWRAERAGGAGRLVCAGQVVRITPEAS